MTREEEFNQLKSDWYLILKESGFKDIENEKGHLKTWDGYYFVKRYTPITLEAKRAYYVMASRFLHLFRFETKNQLIIWKLHSEGLSVREIVKLTRKKLGYVHKTICYLRKLMFLFEKELFF